MQQQATSWIIKRMHKVKHQLEAQNAQCTSAPTLLHHCDDLTDDGRTAAA